MVCAAGVAGDAMVCDPGIVGAWPSPHGAWPSPHNAQTVAAALTLAESRPYVPVRFGGFGCLSQRFVRLGRPHIRPHITQAPSYV